MDKSIKINDINGNMINASIVSLKESYIDKIMALQGEIIANLEDKSLFAKTEKSEFEDMINNTGEIIGVINEKDELIAFGAMVKPGKADFNLGYDIGLDEEKILQVGHIESTVVHPNYRGNGLQKILCEVLENIARSNGCTILCATVSPNNKFSLRTLLSLDYKIVLEKEKYGGLKRYIVLKNNNGIKL